jgi:hypothetical protein
MLGVTIGTVILRMTAKRPEFDRHLDIILTNDALDSMI